MKDFHREIINFSCFDSLSIYKLCVPAYPTPILLSAPGGSPLQIPPLVPPSPLASLPIWRRQMGALVSCSLLFVLCFWKRLVPPQPHLP